MLLSFRCIRIFSLWSFIMAKLCLKLFDWIIQKLSSLFTIGKSWRSVIIVNWQGTSKPQLVPWVTIVDILHNKVSYVWLFEYSEDSWQTRSFRQCSKSRWMFFLLVMMPLVSPSAYTTVLAGRLRHQFIIWQVTSFLESSILAGNHIMRLPDCQTIRIPFSLIHRSF